MKVIVGNSITVKNPTDVLKKWCEQTLVIPNPEHANKKRMGFRIGNTPKTLTLYETVGKDLVLPFGTLKQAPFGDAEYTADFAQFDFIDFGNSDMGLYDYQQLAVNEMIAKHYGILVSGTGTGKTQIGIALIKKLGKRALWLTNKLDLLKQSKDRAAQYIDKSLLGTISEGKVAIGDGITFATVQTLSRLDLARYRNTWDVIVVDEVHHLVGSPTKVTQFSKILGALAARHKYGLTATAHRSDGLMKACYALIGDVIHIVPEDAVCDKVMKLGVLPINTGIRATRECINTDGTLNYTKLITYLCTNKERNAVILNAILENSHRSCLILSDRLDHFEYLMAALPITERENSVMITGMMASKRAKLERERALEDMRTGQKNIMFATYSLAREGLDIPRLERLFLTTPQKDYAVITQSIGRIARTFAGKSDAIVYDFVDDIKFLIKSYQKRCATYRKNNCYFLEETND